ncbi:hypothetical protein AF332_11460 [Sporosarcina globispora]|uniref:SpoVT-AbrB domain-containing protein n=1 Tax=Sporosarcina globispora TaxID=1459 RepID=A0A0M0GD76_SPOGL|nr:hypothetical protein [Sporosarcina globispora]KON87381.1 hypothetical protein AF332_11460 [Sporosarcina globispora]
MEVERKIRKIGNSSGIILPTDYLRYIGVEIGDTVYITMEENEIRIRSEKGKETNDEFKDKVLAIIEEYMGKEESK